MRKIVVVDYDPLWRDVFKRFKENYIEALQGLNVDIEHVGSTSVEGLAAKPIIDIDILTDDVETLNQVIKGLEKIGYKHVGDLGIEGREAFKLENHNPNFDYPHHLYAGIKDCLAFKNHLIFRENLRRNPEAVKEYSELKKALAKKFPHDIDSYIEGKTEFVLSVLNGAGITDEERDLIEYQNKS